jgi:predicted dehydrogenase
MNTYRLGIIGLGRMGSTIDAEVEGYPAVTLPYSIAAAARAVPQLELAAGCDLAPEKNAAFSEKWAVPKEHTYRSHREMLDEHLDMVAVCTPGPTHAWLTLEAARTKGVSMIYCEKAMACCLQGTAKPTERGADEVKREIESKHIGFNTGVLRRFDTRYHKARELIQEGKIGTPRAIVHYASASLLHGHIHSVDAVLFLLQKKAIPQPDDPRVSAVRGELRPRSIVIPNRRYDRDPLAVFRLELDNGVEATTVPAGNWDFEVIGDEGALGCLNNNLNWYLRTRQPLSKKFHAFLPSDFPAVRPRSATVRCLEDLIQAREEHRPTLNEVGVAHHATEVCLAMAESHLQDGRRVTLPLKRRDLYVYHF